MTTVPTVGSLCSGYGGLELGLELAIGPVAHTWHAEVDSDASAVLAANWPGVPNLGDITAVDWSQVPAVDILCAGYPCQGESNAGLRRGADDPRFRWPNVADAIRALRPRLVVLENVRGHLRRSFGRVVADLAALGYVGSWACVRASDTGAAHRRERVVIVAWPATAGGPPVRADGTAGAAAADGLTLLPTPSASRGDARGGRIPNRETAYRRMYVEGRRNLDDAVALLPTPRASDGPNGDPNQRGRRGDLALPSAVMQFLPTPTVGDSRNSRNATANRTAPKPTTTTTSWTLSDVAHADRWGEYGPAISRWEGVVGRTAPDPTTPNPAGQPRLSPLFVEWLMGLPEGWVTKHVPETDPNGRHRPARVRSAALRILGNGVVPQQAALALRQLLSDTTAAA